MPSSRTNRPQQKKPLSFIAEQRLSDEGARPNPIGVGSAPAQGLDDGPHDHHRVHSVEGSNVLASVRLRSPVEGFPVLGTGYRISQWRG